MGVQLQVVSQTITAPEDLSWLASSDGLQFVDPITLDATTFSTAAFPNLFVPSGTVLAKTGTAAGAKVGPATGGTAGTASAGTQAIGFLAFSVDLTNGGLVAAGADAGAALLWRGEVLTDKVPKGTGVSGSGTGQGSLDVTAQGVLAAKFRFRTSAGV